MRNKQLVFIIGLVLWIALVGFINSNVAGHSVGNTYDDQYDELRDRQDRKAELEAKIRDLQSQERTLANQIEFLESQIYLTLLQQEDTQQQIEETRLLLEEVNVDIEELMAKLDNLDGSISDLYDVLALRIRTSYELGHVSQGFVFDMDNLRDAVLQVVYLQSIQKEDQRLLTQMNDTREVYFKQKRKLEELKLEKEELKVELETQSALLAQQKVDLANQQSAKAWLLQVTQNEESEYQRLLAQIEEEIRAIRAALTNIGTQIGEVARGDVVGHLGNTGCSTGPHLHFGYYINGVAVDPRSYIQDGTLSWPLADPQVTQWYGENYTWYMNNFGIPGHNGIDLVDATVGYGAPVLAAASGTAYKVSDSQACSMTGTVGQGVRVDHADGSKTIYWHLQ